MRDFEIFRREAVAWLERELLETGDLSKGVFWAGMVQGLIHDIPTVQELIDRIVGEAEGIVRKRLEGMLGSARHSIAA